MPFITVSGLRPRDARLISFTRDLMVGQKLFLRRVGRGAISRPVGFARPYSSREKRSPPQDPRGVVRETTPSNANKGRAARDGCVCAPADLQRSFPLFGASHGVLRRRRRARHFFG